MYQPGNSITLNTSVTLYATWQLKDSVILTYASSDEAMGAVTWNKDVINPETGIPKGSSASANPGYKFVNWTCNGTEVSTNETLTKDVIDQFAKVDNRYIARTFVANFVKDEDQWVTVNFLPGEHGTLEGTTSYTDILTGTTWEDAGITVPTINANHGWTANGWDAAFAETIESNLTYTAQYEKDAADWVTVTFLPGEHGTLEGTTSYTDILTGTTWEDAGITVPTINANHGWTANGWDAAFAETIESNLTYTAQYEKDAADWVTVSFLPGEHGTLEGTTSYADILTGTTWEDAGITAPTINANHGWTANGWDAAFAETIESNLTYTAQYEKDAADWVTVTFLPGEHGTLEGTTSYTDILTGTTWEDAGITVPTINANHGWTANGWDAAFAETIESNLTYTAQYEKDAADWVTVSFLPGEHGTLEGTTSYADILTGTTWEDAGITAPTINANHGWTANGWDAAFAETIESNLTYTAQYEKDAADWVTVTFLPGTNGTLEGTTSYTDILTGTTWADAGITAPTINANHGWTANGWDAAFAETIESNLTYTAQYEKDAADWVTVNFLPGTNGTLEGTTSYTDILTGTTWEDAGITVPTINANHGWTANGWDAAFAETIESNLTYTAQYEKDAADWVTVSFLPGEHGTLEGTTSYTDILTGTTWEDAGITVPTINANHGWTANGWDAAFAETIESNLTYTAQYEKDAADWVTVTFLPGTNGTLEGTTSYTDILTGTTWADAGITAPTINANHGWTANGWDAAFAETIESNLTYTAQYEKDAADWVTVNFLPGTNGTLEGTTSYTDILTGTTWEDAGITVPTINANHGWTANGWDAAFAETIESNLTYTAQYEKDAADWVTVTFLPGTNGTLDGKTSYTDILTGTTWEDAGITAPTINANHGWTANGWDAAFAETIESNLTYTAQYEKNEADWATIIFRAGANGSLNTGDITIEDVLIGTHFGDAVKAIPTPVANDGYHFTAWNNPIPANDVEVIGNMEFVANFTANPTDPDPDEPNPGCPEGTTWDEAAQACLAPFVPGPGPEVPGPGPVNPGPGAEEEVIVEPETPEQGGTVTPTPTPEIEEIEEPEQPEVGHKGSWALINLIASLLGLLAALFLIFAKHQKDDDEEDQNQSAAMNEEDPEQLKRKRIYKWISGLTAVISVIVFVLTENMRLPMILVDKWTLLMVVFFLINAVTLYLGRRLHENEEDEEQTQA
ncbi:hypothetical protein MCG46_06305 [Holdemania massiliensis]|nr:hypothetical protein [Holdemania massiliensis]